MKKEGGVERIGISLPKELLKELDDFCKKNYGLKRSTAIVSAIKEFLQKGKK